MRVTGISNALNLEFQPELKLKAGDIIVVNVVKRLFGDKWAVSINGKIYPAFSKTALSAGERLQVSVQEIGRNILLKIIDKESKPSFERGNEQVAGKDTATRHIISSLMKNNLPVIPQTVDYFQTLIHKYKKDDPKFVRSLVNIFAKKILPEWDTPAIKQLVEYFNYEDKKFNQNKKKKEQEKDPGFAQVKGKPDRNKIKEDLSRQLKAIGHESGSLPLFNHLQGAHYAWLVVPYTLAEKDLVCHGTIKILYEPFQHKMIKLLLGINMQDEANWYFVLYPQKDKIRLSILTNQEESRISFQKEKNNLALKLQKYRIEIDDNIYDSSLFDGFGAEGEDVWTQHNDHYTGIDITL